MKRFILRLFPDFIRTRVQNTYQNVWSGDFATFQEALNKCSGYDSEIILKRIEDAAIKVKSGEAFYEQDGVTFSEPKFSWTLLSALMLSAATHNGKLSVMDFGGSLGSIYFQHKPYLDLLTSVQWNVIEQPSFVRKGKELMENEQLKFYFSPESCILENDVPSILVLATTLPYLENPIAVLQNLLKLRFPYILIDNTLFNYEKRDRITIQLVPKSIYHASYPCWFLDYDKIVAEVKKQYTIISEHENEHVISLDGKNIRFRGFLAKRITSA